MKKLIIVVSVAMGLVMSSFGASAHDTGRYHKHQATKKVIVVKPRHTRVLIAPRHSHHNTWLAVAATVGIVLALNADGDTVDNNGNKVVFLDANRYQGGDDVQVINQNGITYIIK
ncbi:hypothetical protein CXF85_15700 [Colwellia sp. 75C3]|uniref:hypothetical protein n=1 Tax=Colwellia sp. 75C3 TaxID=888425 RepID=UPI000C34D3EF|nr:hypothetical protein [Colwellia sp. 75C3]PKG81977.1 hypothetical protein CXF85_15700 [Colwellia sp. 75C3]